MKKIAIIGAGNMGGAIARGLVQASACMPEEIVCTAKSDATLNRMKEWNARIGVTKDNCEAVRDADMVVLAVKPWFIGEVIEEIRSSLDLSRQMVASVAAGITLNDLVHFLVPDYDEYERERWIARAEERLPEFPDTFHEPVVFRVVPNTAVEVLSGVTFIAQRGASDEQVTYVSQLFEALGFAMVVEEKLIPAGTSLASCGIAFAMRYIRAAMEGGVELGFRPAEAARIVEHTVKGAAALLLSHGAHPEAEIDKVTTAGGITIKGLNAMEKAGFTAAVIDGLKASM